MSASHIAVGVARSLGLHAPACAIGAAAGGARAGAGGERMGCGRAEAK